MLRAIINDLEHKVDRMRTLLSILQAAEAEFMTIGEEFNQVPAPEEKQRELTDAPASAPGLPDAVKDGKKRKYTKRAIRRAADELLKPAEQQKRGPRKKLTAEERREKKRIYQKEYMHNWSRKRAAQRRAKRKVKKVKLEKITDEERMERKRAQKRDWWRKNRGKPESDQNKGAGSKKTLEPMTKEARKELMKKVYRQRLALRGGLPEGLEMSDKTDPAELGLPGLKSEENED